jgi:teichuronic acid biosynthesis glycosyltransferase TuaH
MNDIIFVSLEPWDEIWRRNQFLCAGLARRYPGIQILFVGPARDVSYHLRTGQLDRLRGPSNWPVPEMPGIRVIRPLKLAPTSLSVGQRINEAMARFAIRRAAAAMGMENPLLWLNPHSALHLVGRIPACGVIYDITDDWTQLKQTARATNLVIAQDAELCQRADAVIVCSQRLYSLKKDLTQNLHLIPNGVDADHYRDVLNGKEPLPVEALTWAKPVIGYTGTIHPERVDVNLVELLARRFPHATVALVGPDLLESDERERLTRCGNVRITGPVPYKDVPAYMRAFDVCMTPHLRTPFTESLNPIKLWEYLAGGKPIVSTDVAGFRDYPDLVNLATDTESFCAAIDSALVEPAARQEQRREEAQRHSWNRRLDVLESVLLACCGGRRARSRPAVGLRATQLA